MAFAAAALPYIYAAAAAATVVGTVVTANNQAANARTASQLDEYNAAVADNQAAAARQAAGAKEDAFRANATQLLAKQRAAATQSGFDSSTGSMALSLQQSADSTELDALMIRHQGEMEAHGYSSQAVIDRYRASAQRANASNAISSGYVNAASGLLSTAAGYGRSGVKVT